MIALTDNQTVAIITALGSVVVAVIGLVGILLARQNTRQHGNAIAERERDRLAAMENRQKDREQLNLRLDDMHSDIQQTRDLLVDHVSDHEAHQGRRVA